VAKLLWQSYCGKATVAKLLWQSYCGRATVAKLLWQSYCGRATVAKPHEQKHKNVVLITQKVLVDSRQLCFGSRRANLGMPGDLVIQERLVALK